MDRIAAAASPFAVLLDLMARPWRHLDALEPALVCNGGPPRLFTIEYSIPAMPIATLRSGLRQLASDRRSIGASHWQAYEDPGRPGCLIETFTLVSKEIQRNSLCAMLDVQTRLWALRIGVDRRPTTRSTTCSPAGTASSAHR